MSEHGRLLAFGVFAAAAIAMNACAYGTHHAYHLANPFVEQGRSTAIALAVVDQRDSVTMGGRPDFVGLCRAGFGNSYDVTTASGQPLAADFAVSIQRGLQAAGYRVTLVPVMNRARLETVAHALAKTGADRLMAVQIDVWKSNEYSRGDLWYGVTMRVYDAEQWELARAVVSGHDEMGVGVEVKVPRLYVQKLEQLLNDPAIKAGLASAPQIVREPPPGSPAVVPVPQP